jgi:hypothetical protein
MHSNLPARSYTALTRVGHGGLATDRRSPMATTRNPLMKGVAAAAIALGLAAGSYGIASAASGSGTATTTTPSHSSAPDPQHPWGQQRSDETLLTGDTAAKVKQLALAKVSDATVVRVETDADGHAAYEAHMVRSDGTPVTVYVDESFKIVGVEIR